MKLCCPNLRPHQYHQQNQCAEMISPSGLFLTTIKLFFLVSLSQSVTVQISWRKKKLWKERTLKKDFNLFSCGCTAWYKF